MIDRLSWALPHTTLFAFFTTTVAYSASSQKNDFNMLQRVSLLWRPAGGG